MSRSRWSATAPATVANVAVGFDLLGHSLEGPRDLVHARRADAPGVTIAAITGVVTDLPTDPARNTAGRAVLALLDAAKPGFGVELSIEKGVPRSSGLGGSAASAVAALVATDALLGSGLKPQQLYPFALAGEAVAAGTAHGDNVGPALLGGLVIATADRLVSVPVPRGLTCVVVHPELELETARAREVLREPFALADVTAQNRNLALVVSGCHDGDFDRIRAGLADVLVEPRRAALIPGFAAVKQAALDHDALGASISGGGPSVFGWFENPQAAAAAATAMQAAFARAGLASAIHVSPVAGPKAGLVDAR